MQARSIMHDAIRETTMHRAIVGVTIYENRKDAIWTANDIITLVNIFVGIAIITPIRNADGLPCAVPSNWRQSNRRPCAQGRWQHKHSKYEEEKNSGDHQ